MSAHTDASERDVQRRRTIKRTALSGIVAKGAMFLPTFGIAKVALPIIGPERFGVLMTILSLVAFLGVADLGVGSSLVTLISRAMGRGDDGAVRRLQANGLIAVAALAALLFFAAIALRYTNIGTLVFPLSAVAIQREATRGLSAFGMCFAISLPLTLIGKIQLGIQRGEIPNYWQTAAAVLNFGVAAALTWAGLGIPWITAGMLSGTILCAVLNMGVHFTRNQARRPSIHDISWSEIKMLLGESVFYLALQLIFLVAYSADTMIVAHFLGAQHASVYALSERLFSMVAVAIGIVTAPLWAAYGEAIGAKDLNWARATLRLSTTRILIAAITISVGVLIVLRPAIGELSSGRLEVPMSLGVCMASWRIIEAVGSSLSVYMFASQAVRFVLIVGGTTAIVSFVAKAAIVGHTGMYAVPLIMAGCYAAICLLPTAYYLHRTLHTSATTGPLQRAS